MEKWPPSTYYTASAFLSAGDTALSTKDKAPSELPLKGKEADDKSVLYQTVLSSVGAGAGSKRGERMGAPENGGAVVRESLTLRQTSEGRERVTTADNRGKGVSARGPANAKALRRECAHSIQRTVWLECGGGEMMGGGVQKKPAAVSCWVL